MNLRARIDKLEKTIKPDEYKGLEETLLQLDLEAEKNPTPEQRAKLRLLQETPLAPSFSRALKSLCGGNE